MPTDPPPHREVAEEILRALDHDLRNPVANILGFVELLRDAPEAPLDQEQLEFCDRIEENCRTLLEMLQRLTALAKQPER